MAFRFVSSRGLSSAAAAAAGSKVCIVGAAGGIGQPMSLLLKYSPSVSHLSLYDINHTVGVAADLSHINSRAKVTGHVGPAEFGNALKCADVVVIPAGVPRKPGMSRDDLFNVNAGIVQGIAKECAKHCPDACFLIISNPVNSTVPIFRETLKKAGVYNKNKLFGVTTLDVVRANTFVAENQKWDVASTNITVVGGHAGTTILPLLSQVKNAKFSEDDLKNLTKRIQFGGDEVVQAKGGAGSATLSMAHAGAHFANQLVAALQGKTGITECTFVESPVAAAQGCDFFASRVELGKKGVEKIHPIGPMSAMEKANFEAMTKDLASQIKKGIEFANKN